MNFEPSTVASYLCKSSCTNHAYVSDLSVVGGRRVARCKRYDLNLNLLEEGGKVGAFGESTEPDGRDGVSIPGSAAAPRHWSNLRDGLVRLHNSDVVISGSGVKLLMGTITGDFTEMLESSWMFRIDGVVDSYVERERAFNAFCGCEKDIIVNKHSTAKVKA